MKPLRIITLALAFLLPLLCFAPPPPQKKPKKKPNTTQPQQQMSRVPSSNRTSSNNAGSNSANSGNSSSGATVSPLKYEYCPDSNHPHKIDLGLPSGTLWACCNVGASKPEGYGSYYAWGETSTKSNYGWHTYKYCNGGGRTLTKYNTDANYGTLDNYTQLELSDDAARANWGSPWRMPTLEQQKELCDNCTYIWTYHNGIKGGKFTSKKNGRCIFLPAAGVRVYSELEHAGSDGYYWSSTHHKGYTDHARSLNFNFGVWCGNGWRDVGRPVRPVQ